MAAASADLEAGARGDRRDRERLRATTIASAPSRASRRRTLRSFDALVRHAYDGYYSHRRLLGRLGLEPGPVQPRGHRIETADLPDLGRVIARGPIYRPA